jgi:hypothetical protein
MAQIHYYGGTHLHYLTVSTYHRVRLSDSEWFKTHFITVLDELLTRMGFKLGGKT